VLKRHVHALKDTYFFHAKCFKKSHLGIKIAFFFLAFLPKALLKEEMIPNRFRHNPGYSHATKG